IGVARRTPAGIPVIAVCGSLREDLPDFPVENIVAAFPIISKVDSLENTLASAYQNLERTACNIGNLLALSQGK
ncbi:glycerate kinase, partial [Streptococcus sobrinus]